MEPSGAGGGVAGGGVAGTTWAGLRVPEFRAVGPHVRRGRGGRGVAAEGRDTAAGFLQRPCAPGVPLLPAWQRRARAGGGARATGGGDRRTGDSELFGRSGPD